MYSRKTTIGLVLFLAFGGLHARGQAQPGNELSQVRQEMEQLKQEYEQQRLDYEQRLKKLDDQLKRMEISSTVPATAPAPTLASPATVASVPPNPSAGLISQSSQNPPDQALSSVQAGQIQNPFNQNTESIQLALSEEEKKRVRERMEHVLQHYVDISGYFRAGYGRDSDGGPQVAFQAPGALAKGRLGNEAENYGELTIGKNFYLPGAFALRRSPSGGAVSSEPIGRVQVRLSMYNPYSNYLVSNDTQFGLAEAWAAMGNLIDSQRSMTFWAGNRFYRRHDMHIDDFFLYNMSGGGGGVEDIQTPIGKIALAWIGIGSQSGFSDIPQPDPVNKAGFNKTNFDFRLYGFKLIGGKGEFGFDVSRATSGKDQNGLQAPNVSGVSFTFIHTTEKWAAGQNNLNKFYIQYGRGPAKTFTSGFETFSTSSGTFIRPDAPDAYRFRVADNLIFETGDHFSISPVVLYQATDNKQYGGMQHWFSIGARPQVNFTNYFNVALEPFFDWVDDKSTNVTDSLFKVTLAPQIVAGRGFMSRPAIRAFLTYAHWGNGFVGKVGGLDYATTNEGLTWGFQMESWW